jgi:hypothetical protein
MRGVVFRATAASGVALAATAWAPAAPADEPESPYAAPAPPAAPAPTLAPSRAVVPPVTFVVQETRPDANLIGSGVLLLGLSYGASVIIGATSGRQEDKHLYVPVAGPWIDLARRAPCLDDSCPHETGNKILLVADGIIQGAGLLQILGGFLFPETRYVTHIASRRVHVAPVAGPGGVGISASGVF